MPSCSSLGLRACSRSQAQAGPARPAWQDRAVVKSHFAEPPVSGFGVAAGRAPMIISSPLSIRGYPRLSSAAMRRQSRAVKGRRSLPRLPKSHRPPRRRRLRWPSGAVSPGCSRPQKVASRSESCPAARALPGAAALARSALHDAHPGPAGSPRVRARASRHVALQHISVLRGHGGGGRQRTADRRRRRDRGRPGARGAAPWRGHDSHRRHGRVGGLRGRARGRAGA